MRLFLTITLIALLQLFYVVATPIPTAAGSVPSTIEGSREGTPDVKAHGVSTVDQQGAALKSTPSEELVRFRMIRRSYGYPGGADISMRRVDVIPEVDPVSVSPEPRTHITSLVKRSWASFKHAMGKIFGVVTKVLSYVPGPVGMVAKAAGLIQKGVEAVKAIRNKVKGK